MKKNVCCLICIASFLSLPTPSAAQTVDDCMVGRWSIDHGSITSHFVIVNGAIGGGAAGDAVMEIDDVGALDFHVKDFRIAYGNADQSEHMIVLSGVSRNSVETIDGTMSSSNQELGIEALSDFTERGEFSPFIPSEFLGLGFLSDPSGEYTCDAKFLTLLNAREGGIPVLWRRLP